MLTLVEYLEDSPQLIMKQHVKGDSRFRHELTTSSTQGEKKTYRGLKLTHKAHNVYSTVKKQMGNTPEIQTMQRDKTQQTGRRRKIYSTSYMGVVKSIENTLHFKQIFRN